MKTEYIILGYSLGNVMPYIATGKDMMSFNLAENVKFAKRWKTPGGAAKYIETAEKAGSDWRYLILPVEPEDRSRTASELGKLGAGIAKTITPAESQARRERLAAARAKRWEPTRYTVPKKASVQAYADTNGVPPRGSKRAD